MSGGMPTEQVARRSTSTVAALVSGPKPSKSPPTILLSGCTFTRCSIAFSSNAANNNENQVAE